MKKNILLLGVLFDSDNRGVNALGIGALNLLAKSQAEVSYNVLSCFFVSKKEKCSVDFDGNVVEFNVCSFPKKDYLLAMFGLVAYKLLRIKPKGELAKMYLDADVVYNVNQGDSFSDIYGCKRIVRHFIDSFLAIMARKLLVFLPQTIGPFNTKLGRFLGTYVLRRAARIYVRDNKAISFLDTIKVPYVQSVDMAVHMSPKKCDFTINDNTVGLNVNGLMYMQNYASLRNKFDSYKNFVHGLIDKLLAKGFNVLLVPHTYNEKRPNVEDDLQSILEISKLYNGANVTIVDKDYDAQELKYIISKTDFFLGSRMHSCIASLSTSVPTIGLAYSYKFEGTFDMFEQKKCVFNMNDLSEDNMGTLYHDIFTILENRDSIKKALINENFGREVLNIGV